MPPPDQPAWADLVSYVTHPHRPAPRHRAAGHRLTHLRQQSAHTLAAARTGLREAWSGTDTPAGGLALLIGHHEGPMPS